MNILALILILMPRNSFLEKPAITSSAIVTQVMNNRKVRERYRMSFNMNDKQLIELLREVKKKKLEKDTEAIVEGSGGTFNRRVVKKGTLVWMSGEFPLLLVTCGNPVHIIPVQKHVEPGPHGVSISNPPVTNPPVVPFLDDSIPTPVPEPGPYPILDIASPTVSPTFDTSSSVYPSVPDVPMFSRYTVTGGNGNNGGDNGEERGHKPPTTPEPATWTLLISGLIASGLLYRNNKNGSSIKRDS